MKEIMDFISTITHSTLLPVVILLVAGLLSIKVILKIVDRSLSISKLERAATSLIRSVLKVVLYLLLGLMVASKLGIDVSSIVALASVASLALSLALQDALANVIGGFTLLSTHPFKSGDFVEIAGQSGTIQTIDITYTKMSTIDNKIVSIPNSSVVASQIINYSEAGTRRIDTTVRVSYCCDTEEVKSALLEAAAKVPTVLSDPAPRAGLRSYGESTLEFQLWVWTNGADYWTTLFGVNETVKAEFESRGIPFSFPHVNVHVEQ